jgi:DNA-directed RNA polymerase specialized sigma24 family protein
VGAALVLEPLDATPASLVMGTFASAAAVFGTAAVWAVRSLIPRTEGAPRLSAFPWVFVAWITAAVAVSVPLEWCAGGLVPASVSVVPVMTLWALFSVLVPVALLVGSVRLTTTSYRVLSRRPFVAGIAAGLGTLLLAPPAAAAVAGVLLLGNVEAAQESPRSPAVPDSLAGLLGASGVQGFLTQAQIEACLERLATERDQVQQSVRYQFLLSPEDAEDVAAEALLSVCTSESLATYQNLGAVYQVAAENRARDARRGRRLLPFDDLRDCQPYESDDVRLDTEVRIAQAQFATLTPTAQEAIRMWSMGHAHGEIALRLGVTSRESRDLVTNGVNKVKRQVASACSYPAW